MHFVKAVILFAGIAAAAPASSSSASPAKASSTPAKVSSTPVQAASTPVKASSISAKASSTAVTSPPSASQVALIEADLTAFDTAIVNGISALNSFTGGSKITDQATAVAAAGSAWQDATAKLLADSQKLSGTGQFAATDSTKITNIITGNLTTDAVKIYNLVQSKKSFFNQLGAVHDVYNGLVGIGQEISQIGDNLVPHIQSSNLAALQVAGQSIGTAAQAAIAAFAS